MKSIKKIVVLTIGALSVSLITYFIFLYGFYLFRSNPSWYANNNSILNFFRSNYQKTRTIIQFNSECSKYDSELFYTMKEGICWHKQPEFKVKYKNNYLGLRDEDDISDTEIITLGDSFTLGFGVDQDKTFAAIIGRITKMKTLNAGISSYGTARESIMLDRLLKTKKFSKLKYIVIQYCANDYNENRSFIQNKFSLKIADENTYNSLLNQTKLLSDLKSNLFYNVFYPKSGYEFLLSTESDLPEELYKNIEYDLFLQIIQKRIIGNPLLNKNVKILIFNIESYLDHTDFIKNVSSLLKEEKYKNVRDRITLIDIPSILTSDDYFILDDHINESGSEKVSRKISEFIK